MPSRDERVVRIADVDDVDSGFLGVHVSIAAHDLDTGGGAVDIQTADLVIHGLSDAQIVAAADMEGPAVDRPERVTGSYKVARDGDVIGAGLQVYLDSREPVVGVVAPFEQGQPSSFAHGEQV